jgi:hypothetical protein
MTCDRCHGTVEDGEERDLNGQLLCEDCYMDALSPPRSCDPWAVHSAKRLAETGGGSLQTSPIQSKILALLEETGGEEPQVIGELLHIPPSQIQREIAALRHMEKIRGDVREGKKIIKLW